MEKLARLTASTMLAHAYAMEAMKMFLCTKKNVLWDHLAINKEKSREPNLGKLTQVHIFEFTGRMKAGRHARIKVWLGIVNRKISRVTRIEVRISDAQKKNAGDPLVWREQLFTAPEVTLGIYFF